MYTFLSSLFLNDKAKKFIYSLKIIKKLKTIKKSKYWFCLSDQTFHWYLFQLIVLLKPSFNCCNSFVLSCVDKVTTGTKSFVSVITIFVFLNAEEITQFSDQVKIRLISQLIEGTSRILQKLPK